MNSREVTGNFDGGSRSPILLLRPFLINLSLFCRYGGQISEISVMRREFLGDWSISAIWQFSNFVIQYQNQSAAMHRPLCLEQFLEGTGSFPSILQSEFWQNIFMSQAVSQTDDPDIHFQHQA